MKKNFTTSFFIMSFTQLICPSFAIDDDGLPPATKITGNKLHLHTELMGLLEKGHLRRPIIDKLKKDEIAEISVEGKVVLLGHTLRDIAALNLKNLTTLNLILFFQGDDQQKNKGFLQALFKQSNPDLTIQMRKNFHFLIKN
ncbi:MAG: hypothetical protein K2X28_04925 [Alphaproteobacteria bacterium]|nr:hypothetical protein [Alphaproteobacteria bacterium]